MEEIKDDPVGVIALCISIRDASTIEAVHKIGRLIQNDDLMSKSDKQKLSKAIVARVKELK